MKHLKHIFAVLIALTFFASCSSDDDTNEQEELYGDHSFTYTINGPGISGQTFSAVIPNQESLCIYTALPDSSNTATYFSLVNETCSLLGAFLRINNTLAPLGPDTGDTLENSKLHLLFQYQDEFYTMESLSGNCVSLRYEIRTPGNSQAGTASIKVTFSGSFLGGVTGTNDPEEYQVSGEVDIKFVNE